tara:strand:+ start:2121 stop:2222 length:102 start_codon:yes stop_codon:yes gene_type:complete
VYEKEGVSGAQALDGGALMLGVTRLHRSTPFAF